MNGIEIEVTGSTNEGNWYASCVGQKFTVIEPPWWVNLSGPDDCYHVEHPDNDEDTVAYILYCDCVVVESIAQSAIETNEQPSNEVAAAGGKIP